MNNAGLLERLKAVECPDATSPSHSPALVMHKGLGSLVVDAEGRRYIDLCAGFGALALGHNPLAHQQVLATRMSKSDDDYPRITHGMGDVYASTSKVELLAYLVGLMPPALNKAALALTGAQAVELAVKTAMLATSRSQFLVFSGGYHGLDLGLLPFTDRMAFRAPFRGLYAEDRVRALPFQCSEAQLTEALSQQEVAAVIVEPIQGRAGGRLATTAWLAMLRRECDRHGTLLIYDEVLTGLGRSGYWTFAQQVPCDLLCLGKALGGGFPLSACVGTAAVMDAWPQSTGEALHTGTFFGHPLSCDVALATLQTLAQDGLVERSQEVGATVLAWLQGELQGNTKVREVRGQGLMLAIEFYQAGYGVVLMDAMRAAGVIVLVSGALGETLSITPALNIPEPLLREALVKIVAYLRQ